MGERRVRPETLKKLKPGLTAAETQAILEADPEWAAARDREARELEARKEEWRRAEAPLVTELGDVGLDVDSAWDLVNTSTPYPRALPILLDHLERPYPDRVREGIARALAVPDATFGWERLVRLYRREPAGTDAKDGLAVALAASADHETLDELASLARDSAHGESRLLLLCALARPGDANGRAALEEFTGDPVLGAEARRLLRDG